MSVNARARSAGSTCRNDIACLRRASCHVGGRSHSFLCPCLQQSQLCQTSTSEHLKPSTLWPWPPTHQLPLRSSAPITGTITQYTITSRLRSSPSRNATRQPLVPYNPAAVDPWLGHPTMEPHRAQYPGRRTAKRWFMDQRIGCIASDGNWHCAHCKSRRRPRFSPSRD